MIRLIYVINAVALLAVTALTSSTGGNTSEPSAYRIDRTDDVVELAWPEEIEKEAEEDIISSNSATSPEGRWVRALITVYTPWDAIDADSGFQDGLTSIGVNTQSGDPNDMYGIAAHPDVVPYHTSVYVPGYWEALQRNRTSKPTRMTIVDDTGGIVRRNWERHGIVHLDLRFRTGIGARRWISKNAHLGTIDNQGRLWMNVFIYEEN